MQTSSGVVVSQGFCWFTTPSGKFQTRSSCDEKTLQCSITHVPKKNGGKGGALDSSESHIIEIQ